MPKKNHFFKEAYSQEGEDLILDRIFENKPTGFYVDIGAHHPKRFSNTFIFYKKKWTGINIDAMPGSMELFKKIRPNDINIETPVANSLVELEYYNFEEPALNTFDSGLAQTYIKSGQKLKCKLKLKPSRLQDILKTHIPDKQKISFMSIDVEGLEYDVLQSNDWDIFRPSVLLVEVLNCTLFDELTKNEIHMYIVSRGYMLIAKTISTLIYKDQKKCAE